MHLKMNSRARALHQHRHLLYKFCDRRQFHCGVNVCQTLSVFSNPLDLLDHPLLLDIFFLGAPQLRTGLGFLFSFKVSFMKHPSGQAERIMGLIQHQEIMEGRGNILREWRQQFWQFFNFKTAHYYPFLEKEYFEASFLDKLLSGGHT